MPSQDFAAIQRALAKNESPRIIIVAVPLPTVLYTPYSFTAICSGHWLPQEAAFAFAGAKELRELSFRSGLRPIIFSDQVNYYQIVR
jgi:hypothetical protein